MVIYIIIEDNNQGLAIRSIRQGVVEGQTDTPANKVAMLLEQQVLKLAAVAADEAATVRSGSSACLH